MNSELLAVITKAVVMICSALITIYVLPWLKAKIGAENLEKVELLAEQGVRAAEMIYTPEEWKLKKQYVIRLIQDKATEAGLTEDDVNAIIEAFVQEVKHAN